MRIIKQGRRAENEKTTSYSVSCPICGFEAEIDPGENLIQCSYCKSFKLVFTTPPIDFRSKKKSPSERFPDEYYRFSSSGDGDAVILSEQETAKMIDNTVEEYKKANCGYAFSSTGDTFVAVFQTNEDDVNDFLVVVSKDHYEYDFVNGE